MTVKLDEYVQGGEYVSGERFPTEVKYSPVTLERAVTGKYSDAVYKWLQRVQDWVSEPREGAPTPAGTVTIEMLSAKDGEPIYKWTLLDAVPVQWNGPNLSSKGSDVATEKLVLSYNGLLAGPAGKSEPAGQKTPPGPQTGKAGKLTLSEAPKGGGAGPLTEGGAAGSLEFAYTPQKVQVQQSATFEDNSNALVADRNDLLVKAGELGITISDLRVEGEAAVSRTATVLFGWMNPKGGPSASGKISVGGHRPQWSRAVPGAASGKNATAQQHNAQVLRLVMGTSGEAIRYDVVLRQVNITYTRFTRNGNPCRATVSLTMQKHVKQLQSTNPTSGSPEPGRIHLVTSGESLQGIARETYGRPSAWRKVAENNGIDDPLRVRNGRSLMLPGVS